MSFPTQEIMSFQNLFWQSPVITEQTFYEQNKDNVTYIGLPWATIIDKKVNIQVLAESIAVFIDSNKKYYTCCQHIYFKRLIPLFKALSISIVYSPHKVLNEDEIDCISIKPVPLYAVNIEDNTRNKEFKDEDFLTRERKYLYSFQGAYNPQIYISAIRNVIFDMDHPQDCYIKKTNGWFFESDVYGKNPNLTKEKKETSFYNNLLLNSRYSLCPSGSGPNSIRFWESLAIGTIPILLSDTLELPEHELWKDAIIIHPESEIKQLIPNVLSKISKEREMQMRKNCISIYNTFKNTYKPLTPYIIHYCCGSYTNGVGGVPRYDYHIYRAFPTRIFFQGPQQKNKMLDFLTQHKNTVVITDNHLACDIPNDYNIILVHHGCAKRTVNANPELKNESTFRTILEGQEKMLTYREPNRTKIVSISKACKDDFTNFYQNNYTKFKRYDILHTSELDETLFKKHFNNTPIVLGNWRGVKKGEKLIPLLKSQLSDYTFEQLNVYPKNNDYHDFNKRKQDIYLNSDIFLQISNSEGNSYATLDALICGIPVVASDVGLFYGDIPEDCFVKMDHTKHNNPEYVKEKLEYAWRHKEELGRKGREWYLKHCNFKDWIKKTQRVVLSSFN